MFKPVAISCLAAMLTFTGPVAAQTAEVCNADPEDWFLLIGPEMSGFWMDTMTHFVMDGEVIPPGPPEVVPVTATATGLRLEAGDEGVVWDLTLTDQPFTIEPPAGLNLPTGEEISLVVGCDVNQLPRFAGQQTFTMDGITVNAQLAALALSRTELMMWFSFETPFGNMAQQSFLEQ